MITPPPDPARHTVAEAVRRGWAVRLACPCGHDAVLGVERLARWPAALSLDALAKGAVCTACGASGARWHFRQDHGASPCANPVPPGARSPVASARPRRP